MAERLGRAILLSGAGIVALFGSALSPAHANGWLESRPWQFETSADKANKAAVVDLIERKKGGYYDSWKTTVNNNVVNNNTTVIEHQTNCSVTATAVGNTGSNSMSGAASSPNVTNTSSNNANTTGNSNSNGVNQTGPGGVVLDNNSATPVTIVDTNQSNNGSSLGSDVTNSASNSASGPIAANGGTVNQALNSNQSNTGTQSASVANSTACALSSVGPLN